MREIKFRAWDKFNEVMTTLFDISSQGVVKLSLIGKDIEYLEDYEIMQFTGLKDKNGKECYEGDILKLHPPSNMCCDICEMVFHEKRISFMGRTPNKNRESGYEYLELWPIDSEYFEIIGNIHEHPELLNRHC